MKHIRSGRPDLHSNRQWFIAVLLFGGVLLHRSYFLPGTLTWGDWYWISSTTQQDMFRLPTMWEPLWNIGMTNGQVNIGPMYSLMAALGKLGISAPLARLDGANGERCRGLYVGEATDVVKGKRDLTAAVIAKCYFCDVAVRDLGDAGLIPG